MLMKTIILSLLVLATTCFQPFAAETTTKVTPHAETSWLGVYTSPAEIMGSTRVSVESFRGDELSYRMIYRTDVVVSGEIEQRENRGEILTDADKLYLPVASGYYTDGKPSLNATITRYTRLQINGYTVLMRDDALKIYREQNRLHAYGILIKVAGSSKVRLDESKQESIKSLYEDPNKEWHDPFVHGTKKR